MTVPRIGSYPVPVRRETGSLVADPSKLDPYDMVWRENVDFPARLRVVDVRPHKGTSLIMLQQVGPGTQPFYPMFPADFVDMVQATSVHRGVVDGMFCVRKRLRSYGLRYIGPRTALTLPQQT